MEHMPLLSITPVGFPWPLSWAPSYFFSPWNFAVSSLFENVFHCYSNSTKFSIFWHLGWSSGLSSWHPADISGLHLKLNFNKPELHFFTGKYNPVTVDITVTLTETTTNSVDSTNSGWCAFSYIYWHNTTIHNKDIVHVLLFVFYLIVQPPSF